ncbi:TRIO and F-actin-binding protein-like isoform X1 [Nerophis lumbriciformis]|uniref:TRIO and F-actin-binding protein-like isoform X1 n=2 Tax=Nerophis lumbriciformis TaxID=546530 RepID=UPI002ADF42CE|nr:myosin phosphatase Rho-interacting protein-like isoform X1 [Nerophis lumbriciformis]
MSRLDENGKWQKRWFVLSDAWLKYYRDSEAEESEEVEGEMDLSSCVTVSDCDVDNNYGLQIQTKRAVFTLSAVTSRSRQNWVTLLKQAVHNNTRQSDSGGQKGDPLSCGPSPCQPAARFTCPDFQPPDPDTAATCPPEPPADPGRGEEDWDCDWAKRLEERNRWFEDHGVPLGGAGSRWDCMQLKRGSVPVPVIHTMDSQVSRKWTELERLSFRGMTAQSLIGAQAYRTTTPQSGGPLVPSQTCRPGSDTQEELVGGLPTDSPSSEEASPPGSGSHLVQNTAEGLQKEALSLPKHEVENMKKERASRVDSPCGPGAPCRATLEAMQAAHQQEVQDLQEKQEREMKEVKAGRERMLQEERRAAAEAMEALRAAHREELQARRSMAGDMEMSSTGDMFPGEVDGLPEGAVKSSPGRRAELGCKVREMEQLRRENQELKDKLAAEMSRMRGFITGQRPEMASPSNDASQVETLLRAKEKEVRSLKNEVSRLQDEVQRWSPAKEEDAYNTSKQAGEGFSP